jgi:hypothetical protein
MIASLVTVLTGLALLTAVDTWAKKRHGRY